MHAALAILAALLLAARSGSVKPLHPAETVIWHFDPPEPALGSAGYWYTNPINSATAIDGTYGFVSSPNALWFRADYWPGQWGDAGAEIDTVAVTPGLPYFFSAKVNADATLPAIRLYVEIWSDGFGALLGAWNIGQGDIGAGWQTWTPGGFTPAVSAVTVKVYARDPAQTTKTIGAWALDDVALLSAEELEMAKRREIREALVTRLLTITTGAGYSATIADVSTGPVRIPEGISSFPHVTLLHGEEIKSVHTLGRTKGLITFYAGVACRRTASARADDQCDDLCADIEKAVRTFSGGQFLALGYVENVFVGGIDPTELSPEIALDLAAWTIPIEVTYTYINGQP